MMNPSYRSKLGYLLFAAFMMLSVSSCGGGGGGGGSAAPPPPVDQAMGGAWVGTEAFSSCLGNAAILNGATFTGLAILDNTVAPEQLVAGITGTVAGVTVSLVFSLPRI